MNRTDPIITVIYDNNPYKENLKTAWGFACLVQIAQNNILFDTGGEGDLLLENMRKLNIDPSLINIVVISHAHWDHMGGLETFLNKNSNVTVYLPSSSPTTLKDMVRNKGAKIVEIKNDYAICEHVMTTGELDSDKLKEQALVVDSQKGSIIITGCAHPKIIKIIEKAKEIGKQNIFFVMGGFHFYKTPPETVNKIIANFKQLNVQKVSPCHCSGEQAQELFKKNYNENYLHVGVGKVITP